MLTHGAYAIQPYTPYTIQLYSAIQPYTIRYSQPPGSSSSSSRGGAAAAAAPAATMHWSTATAVATGSQLRGSGAKWGGGY